MRVVIPHTFSRSEALQRVKQAIDEARPQFKDQVQIHKERWQEYTLHFSFTAQNKTTSGTLSVENSEYVLEAKLPFMLRFIEGRIENAIKERVKQML